MSLLTLEDFNSANINYINEIAVIDTSKISLQEFNNIQYDFCRISHNIEYNQHIFTFEIVNSLWQGSYYFTNLNDEYINVDAYYNSRNELIFTTDYEAVKLHLYLTNLTSHFRIKRLDFFITDVTPLIVSKKELDDRFYEIELIDLKTGEVSKQSIQLQEGVIGELLYIYLICLLKKTDLRFNLDETNVKTGIINKVYLNVDGDYLPYGALTDGTPLDMIVNYNNIDIPVVFDSEVNDYCFDLDLVDKMDNNPIEITLKVYESKYINSYSSKHIITCSYPVADSFTALKSLISAGLEIIQLTDNIMFTEDITLPQQLYLLGDFNTIDLNDFSIEITSNCKIKDLEVNNGSPCFIQYPNTKLNIVNCIFNNASITDELKGSVISTLDGENIITNLEGCFMLNCHHSIWHNGELNVKNIKALFNNFNTSTDPDYASFLTIYNGKAQITNSVFDIDYNTNELCNNEIDIKYAMSLIGIGENTIINGYTVDKLANDNTLPLFDLQFNNQAHTYCKYYYPAIEGCVISSPLINKENKAVCHNILGTDWVFKNNVQITRVGTGKENKNRKINWEDL